MCCWQIRSGSGFVCLNPNWDAGTEGILYIISETSRIFELEKRESYSLLIWNWALVFSDPTSEQLRTARLPAVGAEVFGVDLAGLVVERTLGSAGQALMLNCPEPQDLLMRALGCSAIWPSRGIYSVNDHSACFLPVCLLCCQPSFISPKRLGR